MNINFRHMGQCSELPHIATKMRLFTGLITLSIILAFASGCATKRTSKPNSEESSTTKALRSSNVKEPVPTKTSSVSSGSGGEFKVVYASVNKPAYKALQQVFQQNQSFEKVAQALNQTLAIPRDVPIVFGECGVGNAYYQPSQHRIVMCYELIEYFSKVFKGKYKSTAEMNQAVAGATVFTFFHELGHALIGELKLPVTGREEDAADEFSTLLLSGGKDSTGKAPLAAATWFALEGAKPKHEKFWDEHSLDMQRFYGIVCLLYGRDSSRYATLAKNIGFPDARLKKCKAEYPQKTRAWKALLAPHLKKQEQF